MLYIKEFVNHQIKDNTPCLKIAEKLGWTITKYETDVEMAYNGTLWEKGYTPAKPQSLINQEKIAELKSKLAATDYICIKIAEGAATHAEYAEIIAQRQAWRAEINRLEKENEQTNGVNTGGAN